MFFAIYPILLIFQKPKSRKWFPNENSSLQELDAAGRCDTEGVQIYQCLPLSSMLQIQYRCAGLQKELNILHAFWQQLNPLTLLTLYVPSLTRPNQLLEHRKIISTMQERLLFLLLPVSPPPSLPLISQYDIGLPASGLKTLNRFFLCLGR